MQSWARAICFCALVTASGLVRAEQTIKPSNPEGLEFFEKKIRPVLVERCYECHSAQAKKLKGKLRLDTKVDFEKGGESGALVTAGDPDKSLIIKAIRYLDEDLQMPPKQKLPAEQVKDFEEWVRQGAPYPAAAGATTAARDD